MKRLNVLKIRAFYLYCIAFFLAMSSAFTSISLIVQINANDFDKNEVLSNEWHLMAVGNDLVANNIASMAADVLYLADMLEGFDLQTKAIEEVEKQWINFSNRKEIYDEIRYVDLNGEERICIEHKNSGSVLIKESKSTNIQEEYYFTHSLVLTKGQVYVSKLDLNTKNNIVEIPIKPTIRLSTPVYGEDGYKTGIVLLNYYADYMLKDLKTISRTSFGDVFLLNSDSYWLYNSRYASKEWGFMFDSKKNVNFMTEFPEEWEQIKNRDSGVISTQNGYFIFKKTAHYSTDSARSILSEEQLVLGEGKWISISYIPAENDLFFSTIYQNLLYVLRNSCYVYVLIGVVSVILGFLLTLNLKAKGAYQIFLRI